MDSGETGLGLYIRKARSEESPNQPPSDGWEMLGDAAPPLPSVTSGSIMQAQQALPPTYVRSVHISNNYGHPITLKVQFESSEKSFTVEPNAIVQIEGSIDKGGWTAVDPVKSVTGIPTNDHSKATTFPFQSTFGVAVFHVTLSPETNGTVKFTITNPQ